MPGAQTERRGEAGPVRVLLRGWDAPAANDQILPALFSASNRSLTSFRKLSMKKIQDGSRSTALR